MENILYSLPPLCFPTKWCLAVSALDKSKPQTFRLHQKILKVLRKYEKNKNAKKIQYNIQSRLSTRQNVTLLTFKSNHLKKMWLTIVGSTHFNPKKCKLRVSALKKAPSCMSHTFFGGRHKTIGMCHIKSREGMIREKCTNQCHCNPGNNPYAWINASARSGLTPHVLELCVAGISNNVPYMFDVNPVSTNSNVKTLPGSTGHTFVFCEDVVGQNQETSCDQWNGARAQIIWGLLVSSLTDKSLG